MEHDDLSAFLPQLDGVLLISDGTQTMARHLRECERMLEGQVPLLGIVLNRARASSLPKYAGPPLSLPPLAAYYRPSLRV